MPNFGECFDKSVDVGIAVQWVWRNSQPLCASRHSWIVNRLEINAVPFKQCIRSRLTPCSVANPNRNDVAFGRHHWQADLGEPALDCRDAFLMAQAFSLA